ncbi:MAG: hypothetical protein WC364_11000 [Eubacteriales bacterium]|jgi:hypothetical protein
MAKKESGNSGAKNPVGNTGFPTIKGDSVKRVPGSNNVKTGKDLRTGK